MAAPAFETSTIVDSVTTATTSLTVPTGVAANDIILVHLYIEVSSAVTPPSGFTEFTGSPVATTSTWHRVFWKRATGADAGTYDFTHANAYVDAVASRYSGCITTGTPIDGSLATAARSTAGSTTPAVSLTTSGPDRLLVWSGTNFAWGTWTPPTGFTERLDAGHELTMATNPQAAAGATGSITGTQTGSDIQSATLLALVPSSAGGGGSPGTVTHVATSTPAPVGTTTSASTVAVTPTLPTGTAASDRVFVLQAGNNTNGGTPAGWTALATDVQIGPTGTAPGAGTGRRYLSVFYRDYDGAWTMPSFTLTSATQNTNACSAITLRKGGTDLWDTPTVSTAGNTSAAGTAYSVTTGSVTANSGMVLVGTATNDNVTASAESLTSGAITFANVTERSDTGSATGNDVSIKAYTADVSAGGTGTVTHTATLSAASEGGSIVVAQSATAALAWLTVPAQTPNWAALVRSNSW